MQSRLLSPMKGLYINNMKIKIISLICIIAMLVSALAAVGFAKETEKSVQQIVYDFLIEELELGPAAAAGIMGNVMIECGFDPDLVQL